MPCLGQSIDLHVNPASTATNPTGTNWTNDAFLTLEPALAYARVFHANSVVYIAVKEGTYYPSDLTNPSDLRSATSQFEQGHRVFGGFIGTESDISQRAGSLSNTILSGAIGSDAPADNAYHVVRPATWFTEPAIIDGFVIEDGNANGSGTDGQGGGVLVSSCFFRIRNGILRSNQATFGGALACAGGLGTVHVGNCVFSGNLATSQGCGFYGTGQISAKIMNSTFSGN